MALRTSNFFRHQGVREGSLVAVTDHAEPVSVLSLFGAALLGARVRFDPPRAVDARLFVSPADTTEYTLSPGTRHVVYGGTPLDPLKVHYESNVPSENPAVPHVDVSPDAAVVETDRNTYDHETLLRSARSVIDEWKMGSDDRLVVNASLARPETVVAGILAPLSVGAAISLSDDAPVGTVVVSDEKNVRGREISVVDITL